ACKFFPSPPPTFREEARAATLVLYGEVFNPPVPLERSADGKPTDPGNSFFDILRVMKSHPILGERKTISLQRYVPVPDPKKPPQLIIFCDIDNGKIMPYQGKPVTSAAAVDYFKGAMLLDGKDRSKDLLYFFPYLNHEDAEVSQDAYQEFAKADYKDLH